LAQKREREEANPERSANLIEEEGSKRVLKLGESPRERNKKEDLFGGGGEFLPSGRGGRRAR